MRRILLVLCAALTLTPHACLGAVAASSAIPSALQTGTPVDVAPWGEQFVGADGREVSVWWEDPRELHRVAVTFAGQTPPPESVKLQWWHSQWPEHRVSREQPAGAGESGWGHLGDAYQGEWRDADVYRQTDGSTSTYTFRHVNATEFPQLRDCDAEYRTTLKLRLVFDGPAPRVEQIVAHTDALWRSVDVGVEWGALAQNEEVRDGSLEVFNGWVEAVAPIVRGFGGSQVAMVSPHSWKSTIKGVPDGVRFRAWYTESANPNSFDATVVTIRSGTNSLSFEPRMVAEGARVLCPGAGVVVGPADFIVMEQRKRRVYRMVNASAYRTTAEYHRTNSAPALYARVFDEPEQTLARALAEQPPKQGRMYLPLGLEGGRQRFGANPDGSVFCVNDRIDHPPGRDTPRRTWGGERLDYDFGLPRFEPTRRWIEDECLPILHGEWEADGIRYAQTVLATRLDPGPLGFPEMRADDTTVLMVKLAGLNLTNRYQAAQVVLTLRVDGRPVPLIAHGRQIYARLPSGERLRCLVEGQADPKAVEGGGLRFFGEMPPGTDGFMVVKIPFITLDQPDELERLADLDFEEEFRRVKRHWKARADSATQIHTPIPELNRFFRAHTSHLLINCGREVNADRLMARVGSFSYGVFGNESCMMITDLDRRGFHVEAERCLETFLHYQGTVALPGDYASQDGVFNGANGWEQGGYNQHHGWILWAMAEHYRYTGDKHWLTKNAARLVNACRWILRERSRTSQLEGLRRIERGLLPPGSLEDIGDWRCWLSNNVFSWWGLDAMARALADLGHDQTAALGAEAAAYRRDILTAFQEAMIRSPVVPLRDGTWIAQIPSEVHRRGRTFGWITVTLEGPIYLLRTGLLGPFDPLALPILQDYEDNLYLSAQYGYSAERHGAHWFSRGGISMQPNLLCSPHPYLLRDEIKHFLRAYFNAFASCYYPDTQMLTEHPLPDLGDWRGDHYKSSDESNSSYWLRLMFIEDDRGDDILRLGMALPRAWLASGEKVAIERAATHFGPMSLKFESQADQGTISAVIDPPMRRAPARALLRFRHPDAKPIRRVEINGAPWLRFDPAKEWVELLPLKTSARITAFY
jgi:hypothetical protein